MKKTLYEKFRKIYPLTQQEFNHIGRFLKTASQKKGDLILKRGQIDTKINFLVSGIVHQYVIIDGNIFTIDITLSDMFFNCFKSYTEGSPSMEIQEAIADVELLYLEKENAEKLLLKNPAFCYIYLKSLERVQLERENRSFLLQHKSAFKRFELFMNFNDNAKRYNQEVSSKLLSQYLSMSPESFSRAKKEYYRL